MIGSNGPRMLLAALPHAGAWNTWYTDYGNTAEGFAELNARISEAVADAGRAPGDIARSACVHVVLDRDARRAGARAPPVEGTPAQIAAAAARAGRRRRRRGDPRRVADHRGVDPGAR